VIGVVASLPQHFAEGQRFEFLIEQSLPDASVIKALPQKISLSWYREQGQNRNRQAVLLPRRVFTENLLHAGQRWQLRVRLKPAHGNANPDGFDYELWLLEQNILATGSVQADPANHLMNGLSGVFHM